MAIRFSWRSALKGWLLVVGCGMVVALLSALLDRAPMSEAGPSVFPFLLGILAALLDLVATFPLRELVDPMGTHGLWRLVVPNFALWGVFHAILFGFVGFGEQEDGRHAAKPDGLRVFRMHDGDDDRPG